MNENTEAPTSSAVYDEKFYEYLVGRSLGSAETLSGSLVEFPPAEISAGRWMWSWRVAQGEP